MYLAVRTDSNTTLLVLVGRDAKVIRETAWESGRELADKLLAKLDEFIADNWDNIDGLIVFEGPGSFTGLRIGATVANTIAYSRNLPIVGTGGDGWIESGCEKLTSGQNQKQVVPKYGSEPNITRPRK